MIHPTAVIGSAPFAFDAAGSPLPCLAGVDLAEDVWIGPHANVQNGNVRATKIGAGSRIDAFVHVGHDVEIGPICTVVAHAVLCGHVTLERNVYVGAGALIRQRLRIGEGALIGMGAVVTKDVPPGVIVAGNPARFVRLRWPSHPDRSRCRWDGSCWVAAPQS